jgi:hypothetical protein
MNMLTEELKPNIRISWISMTYAFLNSGDYKTRNQIDKIAPSSQEYLFGSKFSYDQFDSV